MIFEIITFRNNLFVFRICVLVQEIVSSRAGSFSLVFFYFKTCFIFREKSWENAGHLISAILEMQSEQNNMQTIARNEDPFFFFCQLRTAFLTPFVLNNGCNEQAKVGSHDGRAVNTEYRLIRIHIFNP